MRKTWVISDSHHGHANIIKFTDSNGNRIRPFDTIEQHDECLIDLWNECVTDQDRVYHLGDVVINRRYLPILSKLKGKKKLIKGNHDIFKLQDYTPYFEDISSYRVYEKHGIILSHIPVHSSQLQRFKYNVHGHLHSNLVQKEVLFGLFRNQDKRYRNVCVEHTNWRPIELDQLIEESKNINI